MATTKTNEEFLQEVYNLVGDEYTVMSKYISTNVKIKMKHNICNFEYDVTPNKFIQGRRCPNCKGKRIAKSNSKTHEQFIKEVYDLVGDEYSVLDKYITSENKISIKHNKCNTIYMIKPRLFLGGNRCPNCAKQLRAIHKTKTHEQFIKEVYDLVGDEYSVLDKYINNKTKINIKHNICGHIYKVTPISLLNGKRCPNCNGNKPYTTETFKEKIKSLDQNYILLSDYKNSRNKVKIKHLICNTTYEVAPYKFIQGSRCPYCNLHKNQSKNEKLIENYLIKNNIKYEREKTFNTLKDIYNLRFDFYLEDYNLVIEYDGEQHFNAGWYKNEEKLSNTMKHDQMKNSWCEENNIDILRIPYTIDNVIEYLDNYLNENYEVVK